MNDAEHPVADEQWRAQQRLDALLAQDGVEHVRVVDVLNDHDVACSRDTSGEAFAERDPRAALDLLLEAFGGTGDELAALLVEHQQG